MRRFVKTVNLVYGLNVDSTCDDPELSQIFISSIALVLFEVIV